MFLVNARSGPNRKRDIAALIRKSCDWEGYELAPCERKEDLDDIIKRALDEQFDVIFAVGGDGTVHEVGKRLIGKPLALAVIPTGSGNGFARHIGFPIDPRRTIEACRDAQIVDIDTAEVNGAPFISLMGVGFDAFIAHRFDKLHSRGLRTYLRVGARGLMAYRPEEYEVTIAGVTTHEKAFVMTIANAAQYGNNARIAPHASVRDGVLDLVILRQPPLLSTPFLAARLFNGTIDRASVVTTHRVQEVSIRRGEEGPAQLDGEPVMMPRELFVRVVPRSLNVLVPGNADRI